MNSKNLNYNKKLIVIGIFGIAMGFLEAIVVVYLRKIYYPQGFTFPSIILTPEMVSIEWLRELTTIVMLAMIAILSGIDSFERILYFLYTFAIWDIFYYLGLKLILNWPESLFTWDILFLIPVPWLSPVLAPILCSLTMLYISIPLLYFKDRGYNVKFKYYQWTLTISGALLIFISFIFDYSKIIIENNLLYDFFNLLQNKEFIKINSEFIPTHFNWLIFITGEILILIAATNSIISKKKQIKN